MSAFYVGSDHIDAMLSAALRAHGGVWVPRSLTNDTPHIRNPDRALMSRIGALLLRANVDSLKARYPGSWHELLWGAEPDQFRFRHDMHWLNRAPPAHVAKLCDCFDYQSCEHEGWDGSEAARWSAWLREAAWRMTPEYDAGPWGYKRPAPQLVKA